MLWVGIPGPEIKVNRLLVCLIYLLRYWPLSGGQKGRTTTPRFFFLLLLRPYFSCGSFNEKRATLTSLSLPPPTFPLQKERKREERNVIIHIRALNLTRLINRISCVRWPDSTVGGCRWMKSTETDMKWQLKTWRGRRGALLSTGLKNCCIGCGGIPPQGDLVLIQRPPLGRRSWERRPPLSLSLIRFSFSHHPLYFFLLLLLSVASPPTEKWTQNSPKSDRMSRTKRPWWKWEWKHKKKVPAVIGHVLCKPPAASS